MKQNCVKSPIVRQRQATQGACNYPRHNSKVKFFLLQELLLPVFKNLQVIEIHVSRQGRGIGVAQRLCLFVCFKGGIEVPGLTPIPPLCLTDVSVFAEFPSSREFPLHHRNSALGAENRATALYFKGWLFKSQHWHQKVNCLS